MGAGQGASEQCPRFCPLYTVLFCTVVRAVVARPAFTLSPMETNMSDAPDTQQQPPATPTAIVPAIDPRPEAAGPIEATDIVSSDGQIHTTGLVKHGMNIPTSDELKVMQALAVSIAASGKYPQLRDQAQVLTMMLIGHSLNISPIAALSGIYIFDGKVALGAYLMLGVVQRSGRYRYMWVEQSDERCSLMLWEDGHKDEGVKVVWTLDMAKAAGLYPRKDNWKNHPRQMLEARCVSEAIRLRAPEILLGGAYTPDELGAQTVPMADGREVMVKGPADDAPFPQEQADEWVIPLAWAEKLFERMNELGWDEERQKLYYSLCKVSEQKAYTAGQELLSLVKAKRAEDEKAKGEPAAPAETPDSASGEPSEPTPATEKAAAPVVTPPTAEEALGPGPNPVPEGINEQTYSQLVDALAWLEKPAEEAEGILATVAEAPAPDRQQIAEAVLEALRGEIAAGAEEGEGRTGSQTPLIPPDERPADLFGGEPQGAHHDPASSSRPGSVARRSRKGRQ